ncbi:MAG: arylsulfatase [Bacteroidales bacterium]|nr:MAG: arylsulfatase [Bacteroidales bacterium]
MFRITKKYIFFILLTLITVYTGCKEGSSIESRPNVIFIITDDQGYGDLGFHGNPDIRTPNLDRFAEENIRFSNFYVCPVCAPTRASLMTGRYHIRTGVWDTYNGGAIMATEEVTMAEVFRDNGYQTGIFGKWHLGDNYPFRPQDQGFNESLIHRGGGIGQVSNIVDFFRFDSSYFNPTLLENGVPVQKNGYCSDIFTQGAIDFIQHHSGKSFFLYLSFNAPHTPLQLPEEYDEMYKNLLFDTASYGISGYPVPEINDDHARAARKVYGMVSNIDDNLGKLFKILDQQGITDSTIIIFITDNGPQQIRYTAGLRGQKGSVYEGGIKVPSFWSIPGDYSGNKDITVSAAHIDIFPTLAELCNLFIPGGVRFDGESLLPLIHDETVHWIDRPLFFHWQRGYPEPYRNIAVRKGDFKLVGHSDYTAKESEFELFNIKEDPWEMTNINMKFPEKVRELKGDFDRYYSEVIQSPNLRPQRARIGTQFENPVILNRNDAKGSPGIWAQKQIYGYWNISVINAGLYDITFNFHHTLNAPGDMLLKIGTLQRTKRIQEPVNEITMEGIYLGPGDFMFESRYSSDNGNYLPFYVTILMN